MKLCLKELTAGMLLAVLCLWASAAPVLAQKSAPSFRTAVRQADPSIVLVKGICEDAEADREYVCSLNTGFFIDDEGTVLTSSYVLAGCGRCRVVTADGKVAPARLIGLDQGWGLAVLRSELSDTKPLVPTDEPVEPGEWVLTAATGPGEEANQRPVHFSVGFVSSGRGELKLWGRHWRDLLVVQMPVRAGWAAAPLLDREGRLAAVVLVGRSSMDRPPTCYALPWEKVSGHMETLRSGVRHLGWIGVALRDPGEKEGLRVRAVLKQSPAYDAGVRPKDILLSLDGQNITDPSVLEQKILGTSPGTAVEVKLLREGRILTRTIKVGTRPILITGGRASPSAPKATEPEGKPPGPDAWERAALWELRRQNEILRMRVSRLEKRLQALKESKNEDSP